MQGLVKLNLRMSLHVEHLKIVMVTCLQVGRSWGSGSVRTTRPHLLLQGN
jgi:hypothetical protein